MKKLVLGACLLGLSSIGFAGEGEVKDRSGLYGFMGYHEIELEKARLTPSSGSGIGYGLGWFINKNFAVEAMYNSADFTRVNGPVSTGYNLESVNLDLIYNFTTVGSVNSHPFVKIGTGKFNVYGGDPFVQGHNSPEDDEYYKAGLGWEHFFSDVVFARVGVDFHDGPEKNQDDTSWYLNLGLFMGDTERTSVAPVKAPVKAPKDSDNDGVIDANDRCPNTPAGAKVDRYGCPVDSDNDGVFDYQDACPGTPAGAKVDEKGCRVKLSEKVVIDMRLNFDTNKSAIKSEMVSEISQVAEFMRQYPDVSAQIQGHTDSVGKASYNKSLSQRRADSVVNYLVNNFGVNASRLSAVGYGEANPIADNATAEGRAANRRAEAHLETVIEK